MRSPCSGRKSGGHAIECHEPIPRNGTPYSSARSVKCLFAGVEPRTSYIRQPVPNHMAMLFGFEGQSDGTLLGQTKEAGAWFNGTSAGMAGGGSPLLAADWALRP